MRFQIYSIKIADLCNKDFRETETGIDNLEIGIEIREIGIPVYADHKNRNRNRDYSNVTKDYN